MPLKLYDLSLHRLHHPEFVQLLHRTSEDFKAANLKIKDEELTRLLNTLKSHVTPLQTALEQVKFSEKSQTIHALDTARDRAFSALMSAIKPYRYSSVPSEQQAYLALSLLFKQFKHVAKLNYEEESSLMTNLLGKLTSSEYSDDVAALSLSKFVTALTSAQMNFETAFTARSKESIGKVSYDVKTLRQQATDHYRLLCDYIFALARVKPDTFYKQSLTILNNSRKYFSDTIARRKPTKSASLTPTTTEES